MRIAEIFLSRGWNIDIHKQKWWTFSGKNLDIGNTLK